MQDGENTNPVREEAVIEKEQKFTRKQWILLVFFGLINLISSTTVSIQAPFYPEEAERKGATATEYGLVFGIFELVIFLTAPIFGQFVMKH